MTERFKAAQAFRAMIFKRLPLLETKGECRIPNQKFWDYYAEHKFLFYDACIGVRKIDSGWRIIAYEFVDRHAAEEKEIQEMLSRHNSKCHKCGEACLIQRSIMRNGHLCYRFFCESCWDWRSSHLPHKLVDYLSEGGRQILNRLGNRGSGLAETING